jgi:hypothetical protein
VPAFLLAATALKLLACPFGGGTADVHQQHEQARAFMAGLDVLDPVNTGGNPSFFPVGHYIIAALARLTAMATSTPFLFWIKVPAVLADLAVAGLLRRVPSAGDRAAVLYMLSPVTLLLSVHHGQLHTVAAALGAGALVLADRGRPIWAAVTLGFAASVRQHLAVLVLPFARRLGAHAAWPLLAFAAVMAVVNAPLLRSEHLDRTLAPTWALGQWGYSILLLQAPRILALFGVDAAPLFTGVIDLLARRGGLLYFAWALLYALWVWRRPGVDVWRGALLFFTGFYAVSPGFGVQWLVWALPFWFVVSLRGAVVYSTLAGTFAALLYWVWTFNATYGTTSITADLRVLEPADLALYILAGILGVVTWAHCVHTAWRLWRCR